MSCPGTSQNLCGTDDQKMVLEASEETQSFSWSNIMHSPEYERYDACYYQITSSESEETTGSMFLKFSVIDGVNIYIYSNDKDT